MSCHTKVSISDSNIHSKYACKKDVKYFNTFLSNLLYILFIYFFIFYTFLVSLLPILYHAYIINSIIYYNIFIYYTLKFKYNFRTNL